MLNDKFVFFIKVLFFLGLVIVGLSVKDVRSETRKFNQDIIDVVVSSDQFSDRILLVERYGMGLETDKDYSHFYIYHGDKEVKVLSAKRGDVNKAKSYKVGGNKYLIRLRNVDNWSSFFYSGVSGEVRRLNDDLDKSSGLSQVYVSPLGESVMLKGVRPKVIFEDKDVNLSLSDYKMLGSSLVAVGFAHEKKEDAILYLWQARVFDDGDPVISKLVLNKRSLYEASLVSSHGMPKYVDLSIEKYNGINAFGFDFSSSERIIDSDGKSVYKSSSLGFKSSSYSQVSQVCSGGLVVFEVAQKDGVSQSLKIDIVGKSGDKYDLGKVDLIDKGVLGDYFVRALNSESVLVYANFLKAENERRPEGWFYWSGFLVKKLEFDCKDRKLKKVSSIFVNYNG